MYVCMHVCMDASMYVCVDACWSIYMYMCIYMYISHMYKHTYAHKSIKPEMVLWIAGMQKWQWEILKQQYAYNPKVS